MVYAGFWRRFLAFFVDVLIMIIPGLLLGMIFPMVGGIIVYFLYKPIFESSPLMATPGKVVMGLVVTDLQGLRISFSTAVFRYLISYASGAFMFLGYLMSLFTAKRQTLHDLVLDTVVTTAPKQTNVDYFGIWKAHFLSLIQNKSIEDHAKTPSAQPTQNHAQALSEIEALHKLFTQGALTEQEFQEKKTQILSRMN